MILSGLPNRGLSKNARFIERKLPRGEEISDKEYEALAEGKFDPWPILRLELEPAGIAHPTYGTDCRISGVMRGPG